MPQNAGYHQPPSFEVITPPPKGRLLHGPEMKSSGRKIALARKNQAQTQLRFFIFWILGVFCVTPISTLANCKQSYQYLTNLTTLIDCDSRHDGQMKTFRVLGGRSANKNVFIVPAVY